MNEYVIFGTVIIVLAHGGMTYYFGYSEGLKKKDEDIEKMLDKAIKRAKGDKN